MLDGVRQCAFQKERSQELGRGMGGQADIIASMLASTGAGALERESAKVVCGGEKRGAGLTILDSVLISASTQSGQSRSPQNRNFIAKRRDRYLAYLCCTTRLVSAWPGRGGTSAPATDVGLVLAGEAEERFPTLACYAFLLSTFAQKHKWSTKRVRRLSVSKKLLQPRFVSIALFSTPLACRFQTTVFHFLPPSSALLTPPRLAVSPSEERGEIEVDSWRWRPWRRPNLCGPCRPC